MKKSPQMPTVPVPKWRLSACEGVDQDIFFADADDKSDEPNAVALSYCNKCEIRVDCLTWAQATDQKYGIWGGMTPRGRKKLTREIVRVKCPGCMSHEVNTDEFLEGIEICLSCGLSWKI